MAFVTFDVTLLSQTSCFQSMNDVKQVMYIYAKQAMSHFEVTLLSHKQPLECSQKMMQNYVHNVITNIYKHMQTSVFGIVLFLQFYKFFIRLL